MPYGSFSLVVHCVPIPEIEDAAVFSELLGGKVDAMLTGAAVSRENVDELGCVLTRHGLSFGDENPGAAGRRAYHVRPGRQMLGCLDLNASKLSMVSGDYDVVWAVVVERQRNEQILSDNEVSYHGGFAGCPYLLGVLTQCPKTVSNATLWAVE